MTTDEFIQEVRVSVWTRKLPSVRMKFSTFVYRKVRFTLGELLTAYRYKAKVSVIRNQRPPIHNEDPIERIDRRDLVEEMIDAAKLSYEERIDLDKILEGFKQSEVARSRGVSGQAVGQSYHRVIAKMKNMKGVFREV